VCGHSLTEVLKETAPQKTADDQFRTTPAVWPQRKLPGHFALAENVGIFTEVAATWLAELHLYYLKIVYSDQLSICSCDLRSVACNRHSCIHVSRRLNNNTQACQARADKNTVLQQCATSTLRLQHFARPYIPTAEVHVQIGIQGVEFESSHDGKCASWPA